MSEHVLGNKLGESTVHGDSLGREVFTEQGLSSPEDARQTRAMENQPTVLSSTLSQTFSPRLAANSLAVVTQGQTQVGTGIADIGGGVVADLESLDVLTDGVDDTDGLVTRNEGELGHELSLVDVLVSSADTTEGD